MFNDYNFRKIFGFGSGISLLLNQPARLPGRLITWCRAWRRGGTAGRRGRISGVRPRHKLYNKRLQISIEEFVNCKVKSFLYGLSTISCKLRDNHSDHMEANGYGYTQRGMKRGRRNNQACSKFIHIDNYKISQSDVRAYLLKTCSQYSMRLLLTHSVHK